MSYNRRVGVEASDSERDEDFHPSPFSMSKVCHRGGLSLPSTGGSRPSGRTTPSHTGAKPLNAKERKSQKYWTAKKEAEKMAKLLPLIVDPITVEENNAFFQHARQLNMNLRREINDFDATHLDVRTLLLYWQPKRDWTLPTSSAESFCEVDNYQTYQLRHFRGYNVYWVDSSSLTVFDWMVDMILEEQTFAMDLECHQDYSFLGWTALIQIATRHCVFLIDPFSLYNTIVKKLKTVLEDGDILKIMHGMANDYKYLVKDFGIHILGVIDIQQVDKRLNNVSHFRNLDAVASTYIKNYTPTTSCTNEDWRRRRLSSEMEEYAANDVIVLVDIWENMKSRHTAKELKPSFDDTLRLIMKAASKYSSRNTYPSALEDLKRVNVSAAFFESDSLKNYELLHQWRERFAAICDRKPSTIASHKCLLEMSKLVNPSAEALAQVGLPKRILDLQTGTILRILQEKSNFFDRLKTFECHNCILVGHAAVHCPFPRDSRCYKKWCDKHPEDKKHAQKRKATNLTANKKRRKLADKFPATHNR